jgi:hypothetical protein
MFLSCSWTAIHEPAASRYPAARCADGAQCPCERIGRFAEGDLHRRFHVPSDTLIPEPAIPDALPSLPARQGHPHHPMEGRTEKSRSSHDIGHHQVIVEGNVNDRARI